ncbi:family 16 glycoside hydrolase [Nocardioides piscis]|uniref:DUF1080 domain-containing protein n=1 Tax=Nocardioides piscis TaxID=2714938 RepID=A0A6G7YI33_9ACTN|nr:family 16 glycoside hydrolase [Nocardioides piscis]QIK76298.1 DUF1080 domain-containing protein [Nocardioides piscis]
MPPRLRRVLIALLLGVLCVTPTALPGSVATAAGPDDDFQKVVLAEGTTLGEVMELTVAGDGRVFLISRAGDIRMYDPATSQTTIIMNSPELGVWNGFEDGGLGITVDPDFEDNHWLWVYYAAAPFEHAANRVSRLTVETHDGTTHIHKSSEKVLLEVATQRRTCCHSAGSLAFDGDGVLHLSTGDNTSSLESDGFSPIDERPGRSDYDSQKSAANTNDLRGKILRVRPRSDDAGAVDLTAGDDISYDIPGGNLFGEGGAHPAARYPDADPARTRPEIFVMGLRNPYRLGVDPDTDVLYWGEVGPDARWSDPERGPRHFEEFNRTSVAMNGGWPYCTGQVGDDLTASDTGGAYVDWDFATSSPRRSPDGSPLRFACNDPVSMAGVNDSPNNTGLSTLPPMTDAWISYSLFPPNPYPGFDGVVPIGGQVYRQSQNTLDAGRAFPARYEGSYFLAEFSRGWIKEVRTDAEGDILEVNDFMDGFVRPSDLAFGPDGSLYVLEYGDGAFTGSPATKLVRIDYAPDGSAPTARAGANVTEGAVPLTVQFDATDSHDTDGDTLAYSWDFDGDGVEDSTAAAPNHAFTTAGDFTTVLTVTDATGKSARAPLQVHVGNTTPAVDFDLPVDGAFFTPGDTLDFEVTATDREEPADCSRVLVQQGVGHDTHVHPDLGRSGCRGVLQTTPASDHGPDANTFGVLQAGYTDAGANDGLNAPLTGTDLVTLQPKLRQAEHGVWSAGAEVIGYNGVAGTRPGGGALIGNVSDRDWIRFDPMSLLNMSDISARYSGSPGPNDGIEVRAGSLDGPVVTTLPVTQPTTDQFVYATTSAPIAGRAADLGGRPLYLVYSGTGVVALDEFRFVGRGAEGPPPSSACPQAPSPRPGYTLLYDGTHLDDWRQAGPGGFVARGCSLVSDGGMGMLWFAGRSFTDFSLSLQFKTADAGDNSGVFVRFPDPGVDPWVAIDQGHEIQVKEGASDDEPQKTGSIYGFDREDLRNARPAGEWNDLQIDVVGQTYTVALNEVVVNTFTSNGTRGRSGFVGLQNHTQADRVWFRNLQAREFPAGDIPPPSDPSPSTSPTETPPALGAPGTSITGPRRFTRRTRAAFTLTADRAATFRCSLDGAPWSTCASTLSHARLRPGSHTLLARAVDASGVADPSPAQHRWTIDRTAPRVRVLAGRSATIDSSPTIRARIIDRAAGVSRRGVRVVVDGRRVRGVRSRARVVTATSPSLTPGTHRVLLVARDRAGNVTRVRWRFAVRG